ncbi:hypothetical protein LOC68_27445 [Blastopirellula sp. JC732]|uniref:Type II/III secretion system secretin-like domain-containing protein n=1 Tax=Blastopirellula sediminis TaxID=2894196 RepID=A0A9X1MTE5_9BACT|nr:hypothetical protein [Blastopirellula sediminis]MCC9604554.1 hypothetical protein [Blastopirellula sediminis]MCC9632147.1 hypothetical protein [Blastopirellula sediminis]
MQFLIRTTVFVLCAIAGVAAAIGLVHYSDDLLDSSLFALPPVADAADSASPIAAAPTSPLANAPAIAAYAPAVTQDVDIESLKKSIEAANDRQNENMQFFTKAIDSIRDVAQSSINAQKDNNAANPLVNPANPAAPMNGGLFAPPPVAGAAPGALDPLANAQPTPSELPEPNPLPTGPRIIRGEGDDGLTIVIQDTDIREVLEMLSEQGNLNILPTNNVRGTVSASLTKVDVRTALNAILRSTGYITLEESGFIYVGTPAELHAMNNMGDRVQTRIYRPNYIRAVDLQTLLTPLLTPEVGVISVSTAAQIGIAANSNTAGGDDFAGTEAVIVRDYEHKLVEIDQAVRELDRRPLQVAIEATILSVKLDDGVDIGVNFEALRDKNTVRLVSGFPLSALDNLKLTDGGLKFGFLDSSLAVFIDALETFGDTSVIASPQLLVLNKQRAEILIGEQKGYISTTVTETASTQSVEFLEIGTQLRLRPFITDDGMIRLEVHPEISDGDVKVENQITLPNKVVTQVTTNVICPDGRTIIIGGLIKSDLRRNGSQIPYLGSIPLIGPAFRQKQEETSRDELIVLLTPRIVDAAHIPSDGEVLQGVFEQQHENLADKMSPLGKRYLGRKYYRMATAAWATGDAYSALRYCNLAIHFDTSSLEAAELRNVITQQSGLGDRSVVTHLREGWVPPSPPHLPEVSPWHIEQVQTPPPMMMPPPEFGPGPEAGPQEFAPAPVVTPQHFAPAPQTPQVNR